MQRLLGVRSLDRDMNCRKKSFAKQIKGCQFKERYTAHQELSLFFISRRESDVLHCFILVLYCN